MPPVGAMGGTLTSFRSNMIAIRSGASAGNLFCEGGTIKFTTPDGKVEAKMFVPRDTRFIPRGTVDAEEAVAGRPRAVTIELR
jgi:hypothetical protein